MRKLILVFLLLAVPVSLFAQDEGWRDRGARRDPDRYRSFNENTFELTPFVGYTWGGTIYSSQTTLFKQNADVASSSNLGVNFAIPLQNNGMKLELMVNRQNTNFTNGNKGLFTPGTSLGNLSITYFQAGIVVPVSISRAATTYFVGSAGVANLDPGSAGTTSTRFSASAGLGVKVPINRNAGFRAEARGYYTSLPNDNACRLCSYDYNRDLYQGQTNFGIYFKF